MGNTAPTRPEFGYHILQVAPNSPGDVAGLVPYFDFIVSVNGTHLDKEDKRLETALKENVEKEVTLVVYSNRTENWRKVVVVPSNSWGGAGVAGISIRFCSFEKAMEHVWHVLTVYDNGPASAAGFEPFTDYIVGTPDLIFNDSEDLYTLVRNSINQSVPLYVYSAKTTRVRLVNIVPNRDWGGTGCLGCEVGYGYLHKIPTSFPDDLIIVEQPVAPPAVNSPEQPSVPLNSPHILAPVPVFTAQNGEVTN